MVSNSKDQIVVNCYVDDALRPLLLVFVQIDLHIECFGSQQSQYQFRIA